MCRFINILVGAGMAKSASRDKVPICKDLAWFQKCVAIFFPFKSTMIGQLGGHERCLDMQLPEQELVLHHAHACYQLRRYRWNGNDLFCYSTPCFPETNTINLNLSSLVCIDGQVRTTSFTMQTATNARPSRIITHTVAECIQHCRTVGGLLEHHTSKVLQASRCSMNFNSIVGF